MADLNTDVIDTNKKLCCNASDLIFQLDWPCSFFINFLKLERLAQIMLQNQLGASLSVSWDVGEEELLKLENIVQLVWHLLI